MTRFAAPDLTALAAPDVIETLDYEAIIVARLARLVELWPGYDVGALETDPLRIAQEAEGYFELLLRGRVNDAARAVLITHAAGSDLDHLAALFGTVRFSGESDADFRARVLLSLEAFAAAGPAGAYEYHARAADARVKGVGLSVPQPGAVTVAVLSREGDGTASADLVAAVRSRLMQDDIRPLTDAVTVKPATITAFEISVTLVVPAGPDPAVLQAAAKTALGTLAASRHQVGQAVYLSSIIAAAHVSNVQAVRVASPAADLVAAADEALWCSAITVAMEVLP
ncbi:phage-related baseplate assembly protein [Breoghania corrubedonensis]|uniref:Phage-related baseplate assembly protein n=1 Tax=Breoghania corrubedonensis TaxID=665038 RepID=A0A2T5UR67_9HYPH|nr:baseplate J/gp47 family protein [Breoghania corrubedonensis]PTW53921.1 phage-related baseplate assembly protein [Breoghania corrubedonensis]